MAQKSASVSVISNADNVSVNRCTFNTRVNIVHPDDDFQKIIKITNWFTPINFRTIQNDTFSKHTPGTGTWFTDRPEYRAWLSKDSHLLWAKGSPGAGKTILSSIVIHDLQKRFSSDKETAIGFAYCRYTDRCSVTDILASFVKQVAQDHPSVILPIIQSVYEDHQRKETGLSEGELQALVQQLLKLFKKTYLIIDALDEAPDDTKAKLPIVFSSLRASGASLLVTSRPSLDLLEPQLPDAHIEVENQKDIEFFIDKQIDETSRLKKLLDGKHEVRKEICARIREKSRGMFLLAALQIDTLKDCTTVKTLREEVNLLPSGVDDLYKQTLDRIVSQTKHNESLATKAIIWLTYAYRSLSITELQHALAEGFDEDNIAAAELIVEVCCGLIVVDKESQIVRLVHYTAYNFFRKVRSGLFETPHTIITTGCIAYLSVSGFAKQELSDEHKLGAFLHHRPLLDYAFHHWGPHSTACCGEAGLPAALFTFLAQQDEYPYIGQDYGFDLLRPSHIAICYDLLETLPATDSDEWMDQVTRIKRCTTLFLASANGREGIVQLLLSQSDVHINTQNTYGDTALLAASEKGHEGIVELLLARNDVDINTQALCGETALFAASKNGHEGIAKLLLSRSDANVNTITEPDDYWVSGSQTALFAASENGHAGIVELLLARNDVIVGTALVGASSGGHAGIVELLLARNDVDINTQALCGETALFAASMKIHEEIVKLLLCRNDIGINTQDSNGVTAIFAASENGHAGIVELLLARNDVDINTQDSNGKTALSAASQRGYKRIVANLKAANDRNLMEKAHQVQWEEATSSPDKPRVILPCQMIISSAKKRAHIEIDELNRDETMLEGPKAKRVCSSQRAKTSQKQNTS